MTAPVVIFLAGAELFGWTKMSLTRTKKDLTGSLRITMFFSYVPQQPVAVDAARGKDVTVYVGGHLVFTGKLDKRNGATISADSYEVTLTARGKTKYLIDSSHQHATTNIKNTTSKEAIEKLVQPWGLQLDWKAEAQKINLLRLRDGGKVVDEIQRVCVENGHFVYETRDGKLRVTDDTGQTTGEPLILGQNILSFSAEQSEEDAKSEVTVKGQRNDRSSWGEQAVLNTQKKIEDKWVGSKIPLTIQHYGDATPEALERRANFETNKRSAESKTLTIEVFHVQSTSGEPWDIGAVHYCEVPPEGIFDEFEVTELTYEVESDGTLKTTLTLSPPPKSASSSGAGGIGSSLTAAAGSVEQIGAARRSGFGITFTPGQYPAPWSGPDVSFISVPAIAAAAASAIPALLDTISIETANEPPLQLPAGYQSERQT